MSKGRKPRFYVFYDKDDFVRCFGTAKELVSDGEFKTEEIVRQMALKIRNKTVKGNVVILPLTE